MNFAIPDGSLTPTLIGSDPTSPGGVVPGAIGSCESVSAAPLVSRRYWKFSPVAFAPIDTP